MSVRLKASEAVREELDLLGAIADDLRRAREAGDWAAVQGCEEMVRSLMVLDKEFLKRAGKVRKNG